MTIQVQIHTTLHATIPGRKEAYGFAVEAEFCMPFMPFIGMELYLSPNGNGEVYAEKCSWATGTDFLWVDTNTIEVDFGDLNQLEDFLVDHMKDKETRWIFHALNRPDEGQILERCLERCNPKKKRRAKRAP